MTTVYLGLFSLAMYVIGAILIRFGQDDNDPIFGDKYEAVVGVIFLLAPVWVIPAIIAILTGWLALVVESGFRWVAVISVEVAAMIGRQVIAGARSVSVLGSLNRIVYLGRAGSDRVFRGDTNSQRRAMFMSTCMFVGAQIAQLVFLTEWAGIYPDNFWRAEKIRSLQYGQSGWVIDTGGADGPVDYPAESLRFVIRRWPHTGGRKSWRLWRAPYLFTKPDCNSPRIIFVPSSTPDEAIDPVTEFNKLRDGA